MPTISSDQISKIIERCFKTQEFDKSVIDHVLMLVNRHVDACRVYDVAPEIIRTIIEAVEDYRLKEETGISVVDKASDEAAFPVTKFLQYLSPRESRTQSGRNKR
jgi:adenosine deaminase